MSNMFVKKLALSNFLKKIDDVILREEILEYFKKLGKQGYVSEEDTKNIKDVFARSNVTYEDFDKLVKQFRR